MTKLIVVFGKFTKALNKSKFFSWHYETSSVISVQRPCGEEQGTYHPVRMWYVMFQVEGLLL
jgi:hypothetical protein